MTASMTGRGGTAPVSSGPEARAAPVTATAIPTQAVTLGCSPVSRPRNTGTSAPSDEIGATTPIVPGASAAPVTATAIPTQAVTLGCSPVSRPRNTGTSAPSDEIGATTPIVPEASAV